MTTVIQLRLVSFSCIGGFNSLPRYCHSLRVVGYAFMTKLSYWPVNGSKESIPYSYFKSIEDVTPNHFIFTKQGDINTFRLHYDDGLVRASIVTILPNEMGLYGNIGLAGEPTTYEVQWHAPIYENNPSCWIQWEEFVRIVKQAHEGLKTIKLLNESEYVDD